MVTRVIPVEPFDLVIFGGTGDLSRRKILPALWHRFAVGQMPSEARIIGAARNPLSTDEYRQFAREALVEAGADASQAEAFVGRVHYVQLDARGDQGWTALADALRSDVVRAFYFAVGPGLFGDIADRLKSFGIASDTDRIVVEKPLGRDLASARALNASLGRCFDEHQIYRIDHYLGKETVQNLMAIRFANTLFEPLWNCHYVDHVQITVAETVGVQGRGAYYDKAGAMRDMVQNHLMQLLCLIAMEPPSKFDADAVRDEKLKVIRALEPVAPGDVVRGQYRADDGRPGYRDHVGNPDSRTESFVAMKVGIGNWRWSGTPFYLRTGKRLRARASEIAIQFRDPPHFIFEGQEAGQGNTLVIRLQPDEGIDLTMTIKEPGPGGMRLVQVPLDMTFAEALGAESGVMPDAYERLIMDVVRGSQTLFMRGDEVEAAWAWIDPIEAAWAEAGKAPQDYDSGGSGPEDALGLMHRDGRRWRAIRA